MLTASAFQTKLETDTFGLRTQGLLLQGALEWVPQRGFVAGVEMNYHDDTARGRGTPSGLSSVRGDFVSGVLYLRTRF